MPELPYCSSCERWGNISTSYGTASVPTAVEKKHCFAVTVPKCYAAADRGNVTRGKSSEINHQHDSVMLITHLLLLLYWNTIS
jgi:hypothetical protein